MIPTLSQVCSLNSPFRDDLEDYAAGHCRSIEIWLTKLESYLEQAKSSAANIKQLLDDLGMTASVASYQGGLLMSQGEARKVAWESFTKRLDLCCEIGAKTVVVACDTTAPLSQVDVERIQASLLQLAKEVGKRGLRAALEFQAKAAFGNNLQTAAALVQEVGSPHLGICLDVFHFFTGPSKFSDLAYLTSENLFHVQVCDLADVAREFAADAHRIIPGDGDFPLSPVFDHLREIGYADCVSIELMNPQIWQVPSRQFGEIAMTALRKILGQASMDGIRSN